MRYLIAQVSAGNVAPAIYRDPRAEVGSVGDATANTLISNLDLSAMPEAEADQILATQERCRFDRSPETDPILWTAADGGQAAMKLNGVLVPLERSGDGAFAAGEATTSARPLGEEVDRRSDAELVFRIERGLSVGYRDFWTCTG
jgi:hypothetical protein